MNMNLLVKQSLEAAAIVMNISFEEALKSEEAKAIAFKLSCAIMASEKAQK